MVLEAADRAGDRPALVDGASGLVVSYRLLADRIRGVGAGLAARGFGPGDVLALWAPNLPQWAGVALGAMAAGGTVTGVTPGRHRGRADHPAGRRRRLDPGHGPLAGAGGPVGGGRGRGR
jgi:acyl-CoA synthetase (AMP-forming)/AMP-acid ligase II